MSQTAPATRDAASLAPSSPQNPWSVAIVAGKIQGWIERLGAVWV